MKHKTKAITAIVLSTILAIGGGIASYADTYTDNSSIYVYDENTNPNGNIGLISYYNEASADTDTMKEYIDAGDTYFANQLSSCRADVLKGKILLKSALAYKGVSLPDNPTYTQIAQGIANIPAQNTSGTMTITAHFHLDGVGVNKTFTDNATQTAWQQYNAYLNSHNTGESYSGQVGCYTVYHAATPYQPAVYDYRHPNCRCERNWTGTRYLGVCSHCGGAMECGVGYERCACGEINHEIESAWYCASEGGSPGSSFTWTENHGRYLVRGAIPAQPAYYTPSCGKINGQIISIDVTY